MGRAAREVFANMLMSICWVAFAVLLLRCNCVLQLCFAIVLCNPVSQHVSQLCFAHVFYDSVLQTRFADLFCDSVSTFYKFFVCNSGIFTRLQYHFLMAFPETLGSLYDFGATFLWVFPTIYSISGLFARNWYNFFWVSRKTLGVCTTLVTLLTVFS